VALGSEMTAHGPHPHRPMLDTELAGVRDGVSKLGEMVDGAIARAVRGLVERDVALCEGVIAEDSLVNELELRLRKIVFEALLRQQPVAGDLRELMSSLHMASELERMGDHCVSIAKIARNLLYLPEIAAVTEIQTLGDYCIRQLRDGLGAVLARDVRTARLVAVSDDRVDRLYHRLFDGLITLTIDQPQSGYQATNLMLVCHHLERIADRVVNIAEDLIFSESGVIEDLG